MAAQTVRLTYPTYREGSRAVNGLLAAGAKVSIEAQNKIDCRERARASGQPVKYSLDTAVTVVATWDEPQPVTNPVAGMTAGARL